MEIQMKNVTMQVKKNGKNTLTITIDLDKTFGASRPGVFLCPQPIPHASVLGPVPKYLYWRPFT